jgi:hypothetical protein
MDRDASMADAIIGLLDDSAVAADLPGGESYALATCSTASTSVFLRHAVI